MTCRRAWLLALVASMSWSPSGRRSQVHAERWDACSCDVRLYQPSGFGNKPCARPNVDFGCFAGEDTMWIRPPCGSIFRCNADHHDVGKDANKQRGAFVRCGSRWFHPAPGQDVLNCSCAPAGAQKTKHFEEAHRAEPAGSAAGQPKRACDARASVDGLGGVSASSYRRLPMPPDANPAVKCCRNKPTAKGGVDWAVTLNFTQRDFAAWPAACEALCDSEPSGRCRYFSHSFRFQSEPPALLVPPPCAPPPAPLIASSRPPSTGSPADTLLTRTHARPTTDGRAPNHTQIASCAQSASQRLRWGTIRTRPSSGCRRTPRPSTRGRLHDEMWRRF